MIITDCDIRTDGANVRIIKTSLTELREKISKVMGFQVALMQPYKLCDYKPAYGYIFQEELKGYDFWGSGDIDVVLGDLKRFLSDELLSKYDRLHYLGHFTLYRNTAEMNTLFMKKGMFSYKEVYSSDYVYGFDEQSGMMYIAMKYRVKQYAETTFADLNHTIQTPYACGIENYEHQVFWWQEGHLYRSYLDEKDNVLTEELMYLHFQKKNPISLMSDKTRPKAFYFTTDSFRLKDEDITANIIREYSKTKDSEIDTASEYEKKPETRPLMIKICDLAKKLLRQQNFHQQVIILKKKIAYRKVNAGWDKLVGKS